MFLSVIIFYLNNACNMVACQSRMHINLVDKSWVCRDDLRLVDPPDLRTWATSSLADCVYVFIIRIIK